MSETNQYNRAAVDRVVYTPGPWRLSNVISAYEIKRRKIVAAEQSLEAGTGICEVYGVEDEDNIANAKLIAMAPEMFCIIQQLATADWIGESELNLWRKECRQIISEVIAKSQNP